MFTPLTQPPGKSTGNLQSIAVTIDLATERLAHAGCPEPHADAERLVASAIGAAVSSGADALVPADQLAEIDDRVERRASREPIEYILGRCGFREIELLVDHRVIVPQERTGILVDLALELPLGSRVHDVGTGSGAIALATKHERTDLIVSGSDISRGAVAVAKRNAARLEIDVSFQVCRGLPPGDYDLVVASLPYRGEEDGPASRPEYADHQPHIAVYAGRTGLEAIESFIAEAPRGLRVGLEHDPGQVYRMMALLREPRVINDSSGEPRATTGLVA